MILRSIPLCLAVLLCTAFAGSLLGALDIREGESGFEVLRDGQPVVSGIRVDLGEMNPCGEKSSFVESADGSRVWNRWCEASDRRYRLEVAARADGAVEISMATQVDPPNDRCVRFIEARLDAALFDGRSYEAIDGDFQKFAPEKGVLSTAVSGRDWRWMAIGGLTFDFNPLGAGDAFGGFSPGEGWAHVDAVRGFATLEREEDGGWRIRQGDEIKSSYGGYLGAKIVIREGRFDDFYRFHALRAAHFTTPLYPIHQLSFAAPASGSEYADGNRRFRPASGCGWLADHSRYNAHRKPRIGYREGAYYSALEGSEDDIYRFANLPDGHYFLTFTAGNFAGVSNRFSVAAEDVAILTDESVPSGALRRVTQALHVTGGRLDVRFAGRWLVSTMGLQPLLLDGEDFSVNRAYWMSVGYEPGVLYRSDWAHPYKPGRVDSCETLPTPGREFAAPPRDPVRRVDLPDPNRPELAWMRTARIHRLFNNSSTLSELDDPSVRSSYLDRELGSDNATAVMISGALGRHNYPQERQRAVTRSLRELVADLHARGIRVFDHFDMTLFWNVGTGYRNMLEHPECLLQSGGRYGLGGTLGSGGDLVSPHGCLTNPLWRRKMLDYVREIVATGVDALQLDEVYCWDWGCTCRHCREAFARETGWQVPMNECDPAWQSDQTPFARRWRAWRIKSSTDFFLDVRRETRDLNDHLVLSGYVTSHGFLGAYLGDIGQDLVDQARAINYFGFEVMSRNVFLSSRAEVPLRRLSNVLTWAYGGPVWDWYYNFNWETDYAAWAMSEMMGHAPMLSEVERTDETPDYAAFSALPCAMARTGSKPIAKVGLYFSTAARDLGTLQHFASTLLGIAQALEALHVPYEFVPDVRLDASRLAQYECLIMTGHEPLSAAEEVLFSGYERAGGRIVRGLEDGWRYNQPILVRTQSHIGTSRMMFEADTPAERAFRARIAAAVGESGWWRITAPEKVATSVWRERNGSLALHFLNLTGVVIEKGRVLDLTIPRPAYPSLASDISFTLPAGEGDHAIAYSPDFVGPRRLVVAEQPDGTRIVTLPKECLKVYAFVRVSSGDQLDLSKPSNKLIIRRDK